MVVSEIGSVRGVIGLSAVVWGDGVFLFLPAIDLRLDLP